jgi:hypothetical protein
MKNGEVKGEEKNVRRRDEWGGDQMKRRKRGCKRGKRIRIIPGRYKYSISNPGIYLGTTNEEFYF